MNSTRTVCLYWGVRTEQDFYLDLPSEWREKHDNISFIPVLSEPDSSWRGQSGFVHEVVMKDFEDLIDYEVYACGPPVMVKAAAKGCIENNLKKENFFSDSFEYANVSTNDD